MVEERARGRRRGRGATTFAVPRAPDPALATLVRGLLEGQHGPPWARRAERLGRAMTELFGPGLTAAPTLPDRDLPTLRTQASARPLGAERPRAEDAARRVLDHLLRRELKPLHALLHDEVWAQWPNGRLLRHARPDLLEHLAARPGAALPALPERLATYALAELRAALPRGIAAGLQLVLGLEEGAVVTAAVESPLGSYGRVMLPMMRDRAGTWRARSLPLPALDEAHLASGPTPTEDAARAADTVLRALARGQGAQLSALRGSMMPSVFVGDTMVTAEQLVARAAGPPRTHALELVFSSATVSHEPLAEALGASAARLLEREAPKQWRQKLLDFTPQVARLAWATLDPERLEPGDESQARALMLRTVELDARSEEKVRWKVGALFGAEGLMG
jgi:hypothetical protein